MHTSSVLSALFLFHLLAYAVAELYVDADDSNGGESVDNDDLVLLQPEQVNGDEGLEKRSVRPAKLRIGKRLVGRFGLLKLQSQRTKAFQGNGPQSNPASAVAIVDGKATALNKADDRKMKNCYLSITMCLLRINKKQVDLSE